MGGRTRFLRQQDSAAVAAGGHSFALTFGAFHFIDNHSNTVAPRVGGGPVSA